MKKYIITGILLIFSVTAFSQEVLTDLQVNPVIINFLKKNHILKADKSGQGTPVTLPFVDDFSNISIYPDQSKWIDKNAFINTSYAINPVTIGVATLDALTELGTLYPNASFYPNISDYLTSKPIRLDSVFNPIQKKIYPSDSVYLSFFYQPQGIANYPEEDDSLVLEFLVEYRADTIVDSTQIPYDTTFIDNWERVWSEKGMRLDTFISKYNTFFKRVMIPITDANKYFKKNFQFRFYNYSSLANDNIPSWASNCDHWHIDYVSLNINRSRGDTLYRDVSFVNQQSSLLKNYVSMPWSQFLLNPSVEMVDSTFTALRNLNDTVINVPLFFEIYDFSNHQIVYNLYPGGDVSVLNKSTDTIINRSFNYTYSSTAAPYADFEVLKYIRASNDKNQSNDTIRFVQRFYNYYAYDDGTPEAGYGISTAQSQLAYQFTLTQADTLKSVQMFFNQTINNASQKYFYVTVWDDNSGIPGTILYQESVVKPEYEEGLNRYHTYILDFPVPVTGTFYVGWEQVTNHNLNVGFDRSNDNHGHIFYNTFGTWTNSMYNGSLMIRPVLGSQVNPFTNINKNNLKTNECKVFPNPANGNKITIDLSAAKGFYSHQYQLEIELIDGQGKTVSIIPYQNQVNISSLSNGLYFIKIKNKTNQEILTAKFIICRESFY